MLASQVKFAAPARASSRASKDSSIARARRRPRPTRLHCGASERATPTPAGRCSLAPHGQVCSAGTCQLSCQQGLVNCWGRCIDPSTDRSYCGASGTCDADAGAGAVCGSGEICSGGTCQVSCASPLSACPAVSINPAYCANLDTDRDNCGMCGNACPVGGLCTGASPTCACPGITPMTCAVFGKPTCVDVFSDANHCGGCDNPCSPGQTCLNAICQIPSGNLVVSGTTTINTIAASASRGATGSTDVESAT